ncbi:MAG: ImmA/IrrE family metallo-endopeptidase [Lachnospiraceae bacterium]
MMKPEYITIIKQEVQRVRKKYELGADAPIGDYIFAILKDECVLFEKPSKNLLDLDGFSVEKVIDNEIKTVVYINTAKNKEKQNFCAAHELGHRYRLDSRIKDEFPDEMYFPVEDIMNRFAAELMMPEMDFKKRGKRWFDEFLKKDRKGKKIIKLKDLLNIVIQLMDFYYVPYKAVVKRLEETGLLSASTCALLEKYENSEGGKAVIDALILDSGITRLRTPDYKTQYSVPIERNLQDILMDTEITKYMNPGELEKYLEERGISVENAELIKNMRKIESKTLSVE